MRRSAVTEPACLVEAYARAVVSGDIVAGRLVRLACARHLRDLETGAERGLKWDAEAVGRVLAFFGHLRLPDVDGPFVLQPWQKFIVGSLFGWKGSDGYRRFRTAYIEIGKGSGKTVFVSAIGLYGLLADGEKGAQIYSAATTQDQAGLSFRDAKAIAEASPALSKRLDIGLHNMAHLPSGSFFRPVSSEHRGLDGKRVHMALIDELHEHPTSLVADKMRAGTKGRLNSLVIEITNSGYDRTTVCWAHRQFSEQVLEGILANDSWFAYVCQLDPCEACRAEGKTTPTGDCPDCDDWRDESKWIKANPGLDVILPRKYLREQVAEAVGMPTKENIVRRLNFCAWTEAAVHAIPMDRWDAAASPIDLNALKGQECYAGLDIGATSDFTALALLFPHDDTETAEAADPNGGTTRLARRSFTLIPYFWIPEEPARRDPQMQTAINGWVRSGLIRVTPGNVVDYATVLRDILDLAALYGLRKVAVDVGFQGMWIATELLKQLGEDHVESFRQGIVSMNSPFREFVELVKQGRMHHDGNPVLRWMASNCAAEERGGLMKPSKDKSKEKIDIITAAVMSIGVAMTYDDGGWYTPGCLLD